MINGLAPISHHSPLFLKTTDMVTPRRQWSFKFENKWLREDGFREVVEEGWLRAGSGSLIEKIAHCSNHLTAWGRDLALKFRSAIAKCKKELDIFRNRTDADGIQRFDELKTQLLRLLAQEEDYWRQRAKLFWLTEGDSNTRFFHAAASARRRSNKISKLKDETVELFDSPWDLCRIHGDYFREAFSPSSGTYKPVSEVLSRKVTGEDNDILLAPFSKTEFYQALKQMHSDKAPEPDGFGPAFYQSFWDLTGEDIFREGVLWLEQGMFPNGLNDANIVLIPKCNDPSTMKDLRLIALCNVTYKIVAKVLANRLQQVLPKVISKTQSAFIEGRSIIDNVMFAFEILHYMKRNTNKKRGEVAFKIDISKAYDRVDWGYLRQVILKLGFDQR